MKRMGMLSSDRRPALRGGLLAVLAAALFGISTPLLQRAGEGVGPFTTAALLYAGAALLGALLRQPVEREARLHRSDLPRIAAMAGFGAVLGPVALAWGLQRTSGTSASLTLALEALFTAVLAHWLYRESLDRRVKTALLLLLAGGVLLVLDRGSIGDAQLLGLRGRCDRGAARRLAIAGAPDRNRTCAPRKSAEIGRFLRVAPL